MTNAIETTGLSKAFGKTRALDEMNLTIRGGSVYGLLGPNGAGKTTAIRVLTTLLKPSGGTATVLGLDVLRHAALVRRKVSLTGQYASVDDELTGHENLVLVSRLLGMSWPDARKRATELLAAFGLLEAASRQVRTFSGGMRRRIDIAASLVTRPEILFLDEPTTGLDPRSRNQVWDLVRQIAADGTTVLLTTQYLEEADRLAQRMAVIDHGRVIAEGTSHELKASIGGNALRFQLANPEQRDQARALVTAMVGDAVLPNTDPTAVSLKVSDAFAAADVLSALSREKIQLTDFSLGAPSLDDVFFTLTGRPPEQPPAAEKQEGRS
ncbi:MAG TPA: ATP-binding cassette domain-containing protein [Polyangiaceae bacterium]|jgi:ABC-2 type transport system ATP-binding protein|nr:ATP-binding cassette domain-containing protein [Polyangiaceae bacterium]